MDVSRVTLIEAGQDGPGIAPPAEPLASEVRMRDRRQLVKRAEDLAIGGGLLLLLAPLMALCALAVRLDSPGPVLLRERRFGPGNQPVMIFRFRTAHAATLRGDAPMTRVGRVLWCMSLDDLPRLFNVLMGTMSLVGPRARRVPVPLGGRRDREIVDARLKPGITGLAQINGYRGLAGAPGKARRRIDHDLHYAEHWSLGMDIRILCITLFRGVTSDSAA